MDGNSFIQVHTRRKSYKSKSNTKFKTLFNRKPEKNEGRPLRILFFPSKFLQCTICQALAARTIFECLNTNTNSVEKIFFCVCVMKKSQV